MSDKHKTSPLAGEFRDSKQWLPRFGVCTAAWCALGIGLAGLSQSLAQPFRIESSQLGPQSQPSFSVPSDTNAYYRLFGGAQTTNLQTVIALSLTNTLVAPQAPTNASQFFYRAQRIALAAPHDSDGDGIDDLWELANGLDPLDPSDAAQVAPGDTRTWLELYNDERAVTFDYQYPPGQPTLAMALAQDPVSKAVYAAGYVPGDAASGVPNHGLLLKSTDGGINWSTNPPLQDYTPGAFTGLTVDPSGSIYAVSEADSLMILKSSDAGTNWSLVDRYFGETNWGTNNWAYAPGNLPARAAVDQKGNVYVAGGFYVQVTGGFPLWFVRKFTEASNSWATVDVFKASLGAWANAVACDPTGGVFVVGLAQKSNLNFSWVVRHSGDGGATWRTVDDFQLSANIGARGVTTDAKGNVYVAGYAWTSDGLAHALVRASSDRGISWRTINDTTNSGYGGITVDGVGRLDVLAGGTVRQSSDGGTTWVDADSFVYSDPSYYLTPETILGLSDGSILTAGWAAVTGNAPQTGRWLVRRLPPLPPK